ncbi:DNA-directed DNA polymerase gamma mip1 [Physocladia obscura]|uniref:Mitochondrial DNA polymerase catalytic subunit n=1 Tax=Physocladia obscura TaxID=109957 RepID=A0AAD5T004_9FUNG|nr:DNA-directed DNA polymerase gamma mip1 [Physocladia obscura]
MKIEFQLQLQTRRWSATATNGKTVAAKKKTPNPPVKRAQSLSKISIETHLKAEKPSCDKKQNQGVRSNVVGIQMLPEILHADLFGSSTTLARQSKYSNNSNSIPESNSDFAAQKACRLLKRTSLLGTQEPPLPLVRLPLPPFAFLPKSQSPNEPKLQSTYPSNPIPLATRLRILGEEQSEPFRAFTRSIAAAELPPLPQVWSRAEGWTRYASNGSFTQVRYPDCNALVFDIENMWHISSYAIMATAASQDYWYSWVSPELALLLNPSNKKDETEIIKNIVFKSLIPLGLSPKTPRVIIGHNVSYDRARVLEEYKLESNSVAWIDTLSLHSAVGGLSSQQRGSWLKYRKAQAKLEDIRALFDSVSQGELQLSDKEVDEFASKNLKGNPVRRSSKAASEMKEYMHGWMDTKALQMRKLEETQNVIDSKRNWMDFGSMNSLKHVAKLYLGKSLDKDPREVFESGTVADVIENFHSLMIYCANDVLTTHQVLSVVFPQFEEKCPHPVSFAGMLEMGRGILPISSEWENYINNAEESCEKELKFVEDTFLALAQKALELQKDDKWKDDEWLKRIDWTPPSTRVKILPGSPKWYRELWDSKAKAVKISSSKRIAPYLLKLTWRGYPVYYNRSCGWMYVVPKCDIKKDPSAFKEPVVYLPDNLDDVSYDPVALEESQISHTFFKIPHKDGEDENCGNPLAKSYISAFETGFLGSAYPEANAILNKKNLCSYWISARNRIKSQFVVTPSEHKGLEHGFDYLTMSGGAINTGKIILPQIVTMGTVTRRAVESTWLTASNVNANRIGSELKTLVQAPAGYSFVGADVDSEELWICSILANERQNRFMTLQGTKSKGTDLHTVTGAIVGISRDVAKVFNYSRFYGAGAKHSTQLLMQHSPGIEKKVAEEKIKKLFAQTKGTKIPGYGIQGKYKGIWIGGTESYTFNAMEKIANSDVPRTPILGCEIPNSLLPEHVNNEYQTSRVNWVVQSSGVDYLHLILVSMNYLMRRFNIKGRFMLSIHDEVRYLVAKEQEDLAALALQISNLWTRAMFSSKLGINDLPLNIAFFSAVDIDHCLRKEVYQSCVTPSNTTPIEKGRNASIYDTIVSLENVTGGKIEMLYGKELESVKVAAARVFAQKKVQADGSFENDNDKDIFKAVSDFVENLEEYLEVQMSLSIEEARQVIEPKTAIDKAKRRKEGASDIKYYKSYIRLTADEDKNFPESEIK